MKKIILGLVCVGLVLVFVGCSKVTKENYDEIKVGMTYEQVTDILGKPDRNTETMGARSCLWGDKEKSITVQFLGDEVVVFASEGLN